MRIITKGFVAAWFSLDGHGDTPLVNHGDGASCLSFFLTILRPCVLLLSTCDGDGDFLLSFGVMMVDLLLLRCMRVMVMKMVAPFLERSWV